MKNLHIWAVMAASLACCTMEVPAPAVDSQLKPAADAPGTGSAGLACEPCEKTAPCECPPNVVTPDAVSDHDVRPSVDASGDPVGDPADSIVDADVPPMPPPDPADDEVVAGAKPGLPALQQPAGAATQARIEVLRLLIEGRTPGDLDVAAFLGIDLLDDKLISTRLSEIKAALAALDAERGPIEARLAQPAEVQEGDGTTDASVPEQPEAVDHSDEIRLSEIKQQTESLKLEATFLALPLDKRKAVAVADENKKKLAQEHAWAEKAQQEAEQAAILAEEARLEALGAATSAAAEAVRLLAVERARAESAVSNLADMRSKYASERRVFAEIQAQRNGVIADAAGHLASAITPSQADGDFALLVEILDVVRAESRAALKQKVAKSFVPSFELGIDLEQDRFARHPSELLRVRETLERLEFSRVRLVKEEQDLRDFRASSLVAMESELFGLSVELVGRLSPQKRERVKGLGKEGMQQLGRELGHLDVLMRWFVTDLPGTVRSLPGLVGDVMSMSSTRWAALELILLCVTLLVLYTRRRAVWEYVLARVGRQVRRRERITSHYQEGCSV